MSSILELLTSVESLEAAEDTIKNNEYELEVYLTGTDIDLIASKSSSVIKQEQWGIYVPQTKENVSSGNIRVRKEVRDDQTTYTLTVKEKCQDGSSDEYDLEVSEEWLELFGRLSTQGLIKTRYVIPVTLESGHAVKFEVDVFEHRGQIVPWVKVDIELDNSDLTKLSEDDIASIIPHKEIILIDPNDKVNKSKVMGKVADLYEKYFKSTNKYL